MHGHGEVAAVGVNRDGAVEIYLLNADGPTQTKLTSSGGGIPVWSPDGRRIAFALHDYQDHLTDIYVMNADGSGRTRLTTSAGDDDGPVWSPDGQRSAFWSDRAGNKGIYVMNADGSGQTKVTNKPASDTGPVWSPR